MLFLHVGLHKTGTTFFQTEVFPRWPGIVYLRSLSVEQYLKADLARPCVASREGFSAGVVAHQHEKLGFLKRLSQMFPDARVLISFRDHASYVNAVYSQFLRYGGSLAFKDFFDLEHDTGYLKREDLRFRAYIDGIQDYWGRPPFVFALSELKRDKRRLYADMAQLFGVAAPDPDLFDGGRRNVSLGRRQAGTLCRMNRWAGVALHRDGSTRPYRVLRRLNLDPPHLCQMWSSWRPGEPVVDAPLAAAINQWYAEDWRYVEAMCDRRTATC